MTTIQDLPEEILYMIFKECEPRNLKNIQYVCRAWYSPAHITLLNAVEIIQIPAIQLFIDSINHNPSPVYLKAVKSINFFGITDDYNDADYFHLDDKLNQNLFYRFPNLQSILLDEADFLQNFDDAMCKTLLKNCPHLKTFAVKNSWHSFNYGEMVVKARLLISEIHLERFDDSPPPDDIIEFLSDFPRLQKITGIENDYLTTFHQLLQFLPYTPKLISFAMGSGKDNENRAEKYLLSTPSDLQNILIARLSRIQEVHLYYDTDFCVHSLAFVLKYLTGLQKFTLLCNDENDNWTETHRRLSCNFISEVHKFKHYNIQFNMMDILSISTCFTTAVRKAFPSTTRKIRTLNLDVTDTNRLWIEPEEFNPTINMFLDGRQLTLPKISDVFFNTTYKYNNVDKFFMQILFRDKSKIHLKHYDTILGHMPFLKEASIDVMDEFVEEDDLDGCRIGLPLLENLTIRSTIEAKFQSLLDSYYFGLPNLKRLTFLYHSGKYEKNMGEFRLELQKYSLKSLHLDMTPVRMTSINLPKRKVNGFFVLEVEVLESSERHSYKVSFNLKTATRLKNSSLKGFIRGEHYHLVRVTIRNIQNLELFVCESHDTKGGEECYSIEDDGIKHIMILEKNIWKVNK